MISIYFIILAKLQMRFFHYAFFFLAKSCVSAQFFGHFFGRIEFAVKHY